MNILSIAYNNDRSSVVSAHNKKVVGGLIACDYAFPNALIPALVDPHSSIDYVVTTAKKDFKQFKSLVKPYTQATPILADYKEALASSAICMTSWTKCAILLVDSNSCSLGYWVDSSFYWLKTFEYPNSLSLFYSAAARLCGLDINNEYQLAEASIYGEDSYSSIINNQILEVSDGSYNLHINLESMYSAGKLNLDIATSAQAAYTKAVLSLAKWLAKQTSLSNLVIVGKPNFITNTAIRNSNVFESIVIAPISSGAASAMGAAYLLEPFLWEDIAIGSEVIDYRSPEYYATELLRGNTIEYIAGKQEFSDQAMLNRSLLTIPFTSKLDSYKQSAGLLNYWQQPFAVCQEKDFNSIFIGSLDKYGQYASVEKSTGTTYRVITTHLNRNPVINRILELTKAQGYPLLLSAPIKDIK